MGWNASWNLESKNAPSETISFHCIVHSWSLGVFMSFCCHVYTACCLVICRFSSHFTSFCLGLFHIFVKWNVFFKKTLRISLKDILIKNWSKYIVELIFVISCLCVVLKIAKERINHLMALKNLPSYIDCWVLSRCTSTLKSTNMVLRDKTNTLPDNSKHSSSILQKIISNLKFIFNSKDLL